MLKRRGMAQSNPHTCQWVGFRLCHDFALLLVGFGGQFSAFGQIFKRRHAQNGASAVTLNVFVVVVRFHDLCTRPPTLTL